MSIIYENARVVVDNSGWMTFKVPYFGGEVIRERVTHGGEPGWVKVTVKGAFWPRERVRLAAGNLAVIETLALLRQVRP